MRIIKNAVGRAIARLVEAFRRVRLSTRLYLICAVVGVVPTLILAANSYCAGSRAILDKADRLTKQAIEQVASVIATKAQIIINDGIEIAYSDSVQNGLLMYDDMSALEKSRLEKALGEDINRKYIFNSYDGEIILYTLQGTRIYAYGPLYFRFNPKTIRLTELIERAREASGRPVWITVDDSFEQRIADQVVLNRKSVVLARAIKSLKNGSIIGFMLVRIDEGEISGLFRDVNISDDSLLFVLNGDNTVASSTAPGIAAGQVFDDPALLQRIRENGGNSFIYEYKSKEYMAVYSGIDQAAWRMVALIPLDYLYEDTRALLGSILLTGILCVTVAVTLFALLSFSIIRPVQSLRKSMGDFSVRPVARPAEESGRDEITELSRQFNDMTFEITQLIDDVKNRERQKHELEMKALQAQINPHFLANMLGTVSYMAKIKNEDGIEEMVKAIISILNNCMKNDQTLTTVRESVEFMKSYVTVQQYHMLGRFQMQYRVDDDILEQMIPRFILQPIVENALIHGIEPSENLGLIVLRGWRQDGEIHFTVTDNGIGIPKEKLDCMLTKPQSGKRRNMTGIGIYNVQRRLQVMYGDEYGLRITSVKDVFTTVEITIPLDSDKEGTKHDTNNAG